MIQFQCTCHHRMQVDDDQAGADMQCPQCGRLNTVPTATDLLNMNDDGTYRVDDLIGLTNENPERVIELGRIYGKSRVDESGAEIDLRSHSTPLDYQRVGVDPLDSSTRDHARPAPKYDPETGELIRPVEVRREIPPARAALPAPRRPTNRVSVQRLDRVAPLEIAIAMFKPANLVVLSLVLLGHFFYFLTVMGGVFMIILMPAAILAALAMIAHFGNVIDETGPSSHDELPRPLRNVSWHDDLWGPFWAMVLTAAVCYGPAVATWQSSIANPALKTVLSVSFAILGTIFAPAVMLTANTSGSIANLRPDRVVGTAKVCGAVYPLLVLLFLLSVPLYLVGFMGLTAGSVRIVQHFVADIARIGPPAPLPSALQSLIIVVATVGGLWMMHYFCWVLGHVYRVYHRQFPWAYQGPLRDTEGEPRGFAVLPRTQRSAPPPANVPLAVMPLPRANPQEDRLDHVRQSDAARRKASDDVLKNLPDHRTHYDPGAFGDL